MVDERAYQPIICRKCGSSMNMKRMAAFDYAGPFAGRHSEVYACTDCDIFTSIIEPGELDVDRPAALLVTSPTHLAQRLQLHGAEVARTAFHEDTQPQQWDELTENEKQFVEQVAARIQADILEEVRS